MDVDSSEWIFIGKDEDIHSEQLNALSDDMKKDVLVLFDLEGLNLGLPGGQLELVSVQIVHFHKGKGRAAAFDSEIGVTYSAVCILDIMISRKARLLVGEWLRNAEAVWMGWGIPNDLAALAEVYPDSVNVKFMDLQVMAKGDYTDKWPGDGIGLGSIVKLTGLATFHSMQAVEEKRQFQLRINCAALYSNQNVSFIQHPLKKDDKCVSYAVDDILLIRKAMEQLQLELESDQSDFRKRKLDHLMAWSDAIVREYLQSKGSVSCVLKQWRYAQKTEAIELVRQSKRSRREYFGWIRRKFHWLEKKYGSDGAVSIFLKLFCHLLFFSKQWVVLNEFNLIDLSQDSIEFTRDLFRSFILNSSYIKLPNPLFDVK